MGQGPKKFHITDEGIIYRVDDTGEVTELGNVASLDGDKKRLDTSMQIAKITNMRYSLSEIEYLLCNGNGRGLNKVERRRLVEESSNVPALEYFVEFGGNQWVNILIRRFEHGESFLEPVLLKVSQNKFSSVERLASCKRPFSSPAIYHILHNYNIPRVNDALRSNPNSPYYEQDFVPTSQKSGGCFGIILLFLISTTTLLITII